MKDYHGIVIDKSLRDTHLLSCLSIKEKRRIGNWGFHLVSVPESELWDVIHSLQNDMIDIHTDCWYAHFFLEDDLLIVFQDKVFQCTIDRSSWQEAIDYGKANGIPLEQLDFNPHTIEDAKKLLA